MAGPIEIERLAMRTRPSGRRIMEQTWEDLLFLHWPVPASELRAHVPAQLEVDTFDNTGWVGITPFHLSSLRMPPAPPIPGTASFHEINVRTYVLHEGTPGVWFFSLDASKLLPSLAARLFFHLPYHDADIEFSRVRGAYHFRMSRKLDSETHFDCEWQAVSQWAPAAVKSLEFFLVERYCLFALWNDELTMARIHHQPWSLSPATVERYSSTLFAANGLPDPAANPLAHHSPGVQVQVWRPVVTSK